MGYFGVVKDDADAQREEMLPQRRRNKPTRTKNRMGQGGERMVHGI